MRECLFNIFIYGNETHVIGVRLALLAFWVSSPFGFQPVLRQFFCGMSCPFGRGPPKHNVFAFQV